MSLTLASSLVDLSMQGLGLETYDSDPDFTDVHFFFWNEHAQLVRVKLQDSLDIKNLGYEYEEVENPWIEGDAAQFPDDNPTSKLSLNTHERVQAWV